MDLNKIENIEFNGIDHRDYPDYVDAYITYAEIEGEPLTDIDLEELNECRDFIYEKLMDYLD